MSHPHPAIFQLPDMYQFFENTRNFEPEIIIASDDNSVICGVLLAVIIREKRWPVSYFSSRTIVYGGPLIDNNRSDNADILDLLLKVLIQKVSDKSVFIQLRNFFDWKPYNYIFEKYGFILTERLNLIVDTSNRRQLMLKLSKSKIRQVNQALKNGVEIIQTGTLNDVRVFYEILHRLYRFKVRKPLPGWSFFENYYNYCNEGGPGVILLIRFKNRIIGGILCPVTPFNTIYEWYVCGLDGEYKKLYPSVVATCAAIDYAINHNIPAFDFMGVGRPDKEYGVRDFKMKFGGNMVNYGRWSRINNKLLYTLSEIGYNVLSWFKTI